MCLLFSLQWVYPKIKKDTNKYSKNSEYATRLPGSKRQFAVSLKCGFVSDKVYHFTPVVEYISPGIYISVLQQSVK